MRALHAVFLCCAVAATARAETLSGRWCGIGEQANPDGTKSYWSAELLLRGAEGRMHYPSLDCGGTLTFERSDDAVHFYRERIEYGRDRCIDGGLVRVEQQGAAVRWEWTGSGIRATGLLSANCPEGSPQTGSAAPHDAPRPVAGAGLQGTVPAPPSVIPMNALGAQPSQLEGIRTGPRSGPCH